MKEAIADFDHALRLSPDCATTRLRRAVAWRKIGKWSPAIAELTDLIRQRPGQAVLHCQRGLAYLDGGDHEHAIADFTEATRLNPQYQEAIQKLREASAGRRRTSSPSTSGTKPNAGSSRTTQATSASRVEVTPDNSLDMACPRCGTGGKVRWDRLGHILICRGCSGHLRVDPGGRLVEMIQAPDGRWVERGGPKDQPSRAARLGRKAMWLIPAATLLFCISLGFGTWKYKQSNRALPELPKDLESRAHLLARAWLKKDVPLMRRLTVTTHDKVLYSWFVRHQPPARPSSAESDTDEEMPQVKIVKRDDKTAQVVMRTPASHGNDGSRSGELQLHWEQRGDSWYFVPPPR